MKYSELYRILKHNGCYIHRNGANHDHWRSPLTGKVFPVGRHATEEVKIGTLKSILSDAGIK